ncbi:sugar transferase [Oceanobacillus sp. FSL W7-1304]|uniref:sugar transferase n=1 Tax=Oceanobacillus sp. FSL W7-1304 TaxID=2975322 RepID=UPI0030D7DD37
MNNSYNGIYRRSVKRPLDFILSLFAIIVLSPVFLIVAILVRANLGSPVLFKQRRPGLNERIFTMYKFRTMNDKRDENEELLPDSIRLTKFGKFLRSTSLDELPGLLNILIGDMSIVGPRPLLIRYLPYYTEEEKKRHSVRPGLTGLAQINGRNNLEWGSRLKIDIQYVNKVSFLLDLKIILKTIIKVFKREDINVVDKGTLRDLDEERK